MERGGEGEGRWRGGRGRRGGGGEGRWRGGGGGAGGWVIFEIQRENKKPSGS